MKVNVEEKSNEIKFPCLMKAEDNLVVLFSANKTGVVLVNDDDEENKIGEYSCIWDMQCFEPFNGEITLEND